MFSSTETRDIPHVDLLTWCFGNTEYDLDKPLLIDAENPSNSISHIQAKTSIRKMVAGLHAMGLKSGDSVCLHSFNNISYPLLYLAVIGAGGRFVGSNPAYTKDELSHLFNVSEAKFLVVEPELVNNILAATEESNVPAENILIFNTDARVCPDGFRSWNILFDHGEKNWVTFDDETTAKTTTAALLSTSGTTGLPKAAEISHFAQVAQSVILYDSKDKQYTVARLLCLPQFHAFAAPLSHIAPLREGHPTYVMKRYNAETFLDYIKQYSITETPMAPPIVLNILNSSSSRQKCLESLRFVWVAGAPLEAVIQKRLIDISHPDAVMTQCWGMTELGWGITIHHPESDDTGSIGRLLPNTQAMIIDDSGNELHENSARGEILFKSPSMMIGYLKNQEATDNTIIDGWLHTGDIGYQMDGKWYIVDRVKDLIKVRGWQVSPAELEACLLTHPSVVDAAVIGVDFQNGHGEVPRAYVVVTPGAEETVRSKDIQEYLGSRLAKYKALVGGVLFVNDIPKSPTGKILKKLLREQAKREIDDTLFINKTLEALIEKVDNEGNGLQYPLGELTIDEKEQGQIISTAEVEEAGQGDNHDYTAPKEVSQS